MVNKSILAIENNPKASITDGVRLTGTSVISPIANIFFRPLTLKYSSTINLPRLSKLLFKIVPSSHPEPSGFPVHRKWQSALILSPAVVWYILLPLLSVTEFKSTLCSNFTSTLFDVNHCSVLSEAFGPINSSNLEPLCTRVTCFSGKSTEISPASSTPVGPPPTIKTDWADLIFSFSASVNKKKK